MPTYQRRQPRIWLIASVLLLATAGPAFAQIMGSIEKLDPPTDGFYAKRLIIHGIPIMAHADVADAALEEAARRIDRQLAHMPQTLANLQRADSQIHIVGKNQASTDLPEYRVMKGKFFEGTKTFDQRCRGFASLHTSEAEENLLRLPTDRWDDHRDILTHEFAHTIMVIGSSPAIRDKIEAQRKASVEAGKWPGCYAATNMHEFFAELTAWYFGTHGDYGKITPTPEPGATWLRRYDPAAYELLDEIYNERLKPGVRVYRDIAAVAQPEGQIRSPQSDKPTEILVFNQTDRPATLFWLDSDGQRKKFGEIPPVDVLGQTTFVGHAWLVADPDGKCLGIYVGVPEIGRAVVEQR
jgi:hypothetical protein